MKKYIKAILGILLISSGPAVGNLLFNNIPEDAVGVGFICSLFMISVCISVFGIFFLKDIMGEI